VDIRGDLAAYTEGLHIGGMGDSNSEKEFDCPKCRARYRAFFRISTIADRGSFNCRECKSEVTAWSGTRDYFKWDLLKPGRKP